MILIPTITVFQSSYVLCRYSLKCLSDQIWWNEGDNLKEELKNTYGRRFSMSEK